MRLEGTLDAFSLPDIFQLLSYTKKTGTLHLRREGAHGAIHVRTGSVTGGRADVTRQELGRRLLGAGLVDDEVLAAAAQDLTGHPEASLAQLLADRGRLDVDTVRELAAEQAVDAVFSLLRWPEGEFAFVIGEGDPDDLGALLPLDEVVTEGLRRIKTWAEMIESVPAPDAVVVINPAPAGDPAASRDEWALLALVDGRRTVADLVALSGRGEYALVSALAGLVSRGLLLDRAAEQDRLVRRQSVLALCEGRPVGPVGAGLAAQVPVPAPGVPVPALAAPALVSAPALAPAGTPAFAHASTGSSGASSHLTMAGGTARGSVHGANALAPDVSTDPPPTSAAALDPSVDKTLLLRLIAGVRGL